MFGEMLINVSVLAGVSMLYTPVAISFNSRTELKPKLCSGLTVLSLDHKCLSWSKSSYTRTTNGESVSKNNVSRVLKKLKQSKYIITLNQLIRSMIRTLATFSIHLRSVFKIYSAARK